MNYKQMLFPLFVLFLLLACNLPSQVSSPSGTPFPPSPLPSFPSPLPTQPVPSPTPVFPTETASPTSVPDTPTIPPTFTPSVPLAMPKDQPVNCRYGPGAEWLAVSALKLGVTAEIVGRDQANAWWYIKDPLHASAFCWVSMAVTTASGNFEGLPVIPKPEAKVINVEARVNIGSGVCPGPIIVSFSGSISTNGPATVTYRWEVRGDTTLTDVTQSLVFTKAETRTVNSDSLHLSCGSYRVILHVLTPNDMRAEKRFNLP